MPSFWKDLFSVIFDAIRTIVTALAFWIAFLGLTTWWRQLRGGGEYETARRILRSLFAIREGIWQVRSSVIRVSGPESHAAMTPAERQARLREVHKARWRSVTIPLSELELALLDAEVFWGPEFSNQFDPLRRILHELGLNVGYYIEGVTDPVTREAWHDYWQHIAAVAVTQATREEPDEFQRRVNAILDPLDTLLRARMSEARKVPLWPW